MNMAEYGFIPSMLPEHAGGIPARILAEYRNRYEIVCEHGTGYAHLKAKEYYLEGEIFPTTGDFVLIDWQNAGESRILATLPRRTLFSRRNPSPGFGEQLVAANFDDVFIVQSLDHNFNLRRLDRYLTLAWQSGAQPVVVLTKADLAGDCTERQMEAERRAAGVPVYAVSAVTGAGMEALAKYLKPGKTIVFLGSSGVGKSSLVNALAGEEVMATGAVREEDSRGRHTTTSRQLILLQSGVMVIDTPGMRELGMWDVSEGLGQNFTDVEQYLGRCKFRDCRHQSEPGCAVRAALESGELSQERWNSYRQLKKEAKFSNEKGKYLREKQQWHKELAKQIRHKKATEKDW